MILFFFCTNTMVLQQKTTILVFFNCQNSSISHFSRILIGIPVRKSAYLNFLSCYRRSRHYLSVISGYCCNGHHMENLKNSNKWIRMLFRWPLKVLMVILLTLVNQISVFIYGFVTQVFIEYWRPTEKKKPDITYGCEKCKNCPKENVCICIYCSRNASNAAHCKFFKQMFCSFHIFVFRFFVFWSL